jgi:hypothetical protein
MSSMARSSGGLGDAEEGRRRAAELGEHACLNGGSRRGLLRCLNVDAGALAVAARESLFPSVYCKKMEKEGFSGCTPEREREGAKNGGLGCSVPDGIGEGSLPSAAVR